MIARPAPDARRRGMRCHPAQDVTPAARHSLSVAGDLRSTTMLMRCDLEQVQLQRFMGSWIGISARDARAGDRLTFAMLTCGEIYAM